LAGKFARSCAIYYNDLILRFEDKEVRDKAYAEFEKIRNAGNRQNMVAKIHLKNNKAQWMGAKLKKHILDQLPEEKLGQMHTVDLTGK
jgi:hypothetical protein